jgi:transposase-like protein
MNATYAVTGVDGRDCPVCYRERALTGKRDGDNPKLTCRGCGNRFVLTWGTNGKPDTIERAEKPAPAAPYFTLGAGR